MNQSLLKQATQDNTRIVVSVPKQRAYLMIGDQVVADGPVSSGRRGHETPHGHFNVMERTRIIIPVFTATSWTVPAA